MESSELLEVNALAWEICQSQRGVLKVLSFVTVYSSSL